MLLKYGTHLVKFNNLLKMEDKPAFTRLSYFNNYVNGQDIPIYGDPYTIQYNGTLIKNTMVINGVTYPSLKLWGYNSSGSFDIPITLESWSTLSIDYWCRLYMENSWCSPFTPFSSPNIWGDNWGGGRGCGATIFGYGSSPCRLLYENPSLTDIYFDGHRLMRNNNVHTGTIFHIAYMFEKIDSNWIRQYSYINGELQTIIDMPYSYFSNNKISFNSNFDNSCYVEHAQLAIRVGDYSINNKQNFPVPSEPYSEW